VNAPDNGPFLTFETEPALFFDPTRPPVKIDAEEALGAGPHIKPETEPVVAFHSRPPA
jgi:hypothetical protein